MLTKQDVINKLAAFRAEYGIEPEEVLLSHGGALLMMGLRKTTDDIDVSISKRAWNIIAQRGFEIVHLPPCGTCPAADLMSVTEDIDVHLVPDELKDVEFEAGVQYTTAKQTLADKRALGREKDQKDIALLEMIVW